MQELSPLPAHCFHFLMYRVKLQKCTASPCVQALAATFFYCKKKKNEHESASHRENFKGRSQDSDMELPGIGEQSDRAELMTWLRMDFLELAARPR